MRICLLSTFHSQWMPGPGAITPRLPVNARSIFWLSKSTFFNKSLSMIYLFTRYYMLHKGAYKEFRWLLYILYKQTDYISIKNKLLHFSWFTPLYGDPRQKPREGESASSVTPHPSPPPPHPRPPPLRNLVAKWTPSPIKNKYIYIYIPTNIYSAVWPVCLPIY